ncbi:uncharacterized protein LOC131688417 [Topomyia yanbarensis]|uniref:uncharacterized protein LOC131688417 n=1 Tax=Topomyia yanbarensis TaxID=2498891 RepID=UPI00273CEE78|nr:uncharacterized protein LOC131688417 [Topomyia yanbarensis]
MGRKCEHYWCPNKQGITEGKSFYNFPKDTKLCSQWVSSCESPALQEIFLLHGANSLTRKKLCSDHFPPDALRDLGKRGTGLRAGSVPHIRSPEWNNMIPIVTNGNYADDPEGIVEFIESDGDFQQWHEATRCREYGSNIEYQQEVLDEHAGEDDVDLCAAVGSSPSEEYQGVEYIDDDHDSIKWKNSMMEPCQIIPYECASRDNSSPERNTAMQLHANINYVDDPHGVVEFIESDEDFWEWQKAARKTKNNSQLDCQPETFAEPTEETNGDLCSTDQSHREAEHTKFLSKMQPDDVKVSYDDTFHL